MTKQFDIPLRTILKIGVSVLIFYFLYQVRNILLWILYAFVVSILFEKPIDFLAKKIPRALATVFVYFFFFLLFGLLVYLSSRPLFFEIQNFLIFFPHYFGKISPFLKSLGIITFETFEDLTKSLQQWLLEASKNIVAAISSVFGGLFAAFSIISLAMFLSLEKKGAEKIISQISGEKREWFLEIWEDAKEKISLWFGIRILACIFVGILTFVCLIVLGIDYPLSLSVLAGILNFIPILGPIFTAILLFIAGTLQSIFKGIFILALFILIQQIENNILLPILGKRLIEMPPFLVLVSLLIGGKLLGLGGAILAVPLTGILFKILREIFKE